MRRKLCPNHKSFPHAREEWGMYGFSFNPHPEFSPRARGVGGEVALVEVRVAVFPTRARSGGISDCNYSEIEGFPHAREEWGLVSQRESVFPTCVDFRVGTNYNRGMRLPHALGVGD